MNLGINITYKCNAVCDHCNRGVGIIKIKNSDVDVDQAGQLGEVMKDTPIHKIKIVGGEPTVHKRLYQVLSKLTKIPANLRQVHTNCKVVLPLPTGWKYRRSPLDENSNNKEWHEPFLVSPRDVKIRRGTRWVPRRCDTQRHCGYGFDTWGFAMCAVAGYLGRLLGINPYRKHMVRRTMREICSHCPYSLSRDEVATLLGNAKAGGLPAITDTFAKGIEEFKKNPVVFDKWEP